MMIIKRSISLLTILIFSITLVGCATTYDRGDGVVVSVKKIHDSDYKPHDRTNTGAKIGGATGAVAGGVYGGALMFVVTGFAAAPLPVIIGATLGGAAIGAVIVGGVGAAAGAGVGYAADLSKSGAGFYEYVVKPDTKAAPVVVRQYSTTIPLDARVRILEKDDNIFIEQK